MEQATELQITGIKCDNTDCDYRDDEADFEDYESFLNKPCPKCGENLLTEADLATTRAMMAVTEAINTAFAGVDIPDDEPILETRLEMD